MTERADAPADRASSGGRVAASPEIDAAGGSTPPSGSSAPGASRVVPGSSGRGRLAIGIDVGGSGIKAAIVDVDTGELRTQRIRVKTPQPSTPRRCVDAIEGLVRQLTDTLPLDASAPVGVGIPGVTIDGVVLTATNIDDGWLGFQASGAIAKALRRPTTIINDADAAGLAELRFGAGRGRTGTILVITLGTGIGTALFRNGHLVPNTELGHIEIRGRDAESRASAAARIRRRLSWERWADEVNEYLRHIDSLLWPDLVIVGGGVSKDADRFLPRFTVRPPVVVAQLRNEAGIVGAAMRAVDRPGRPQPDDAVERGAGDHARAEGPPGADDAGDPANQVDRADQAG